MFLFIVLNFDFLRTSEVVIRYDMMEFIVFGEIYFARSVFKEQEGKKGNPCAVNFFTLCLYLQLNARCCGLYSVYLIFDTSLKLFPSFARFISML